VSDPAAKDAPAQGADEGSEDADADEEIQKAVVLAGLQTQYMTIKDLSRGRTFVLTNAMFVDIVTIEHMF
jgi:hypothetical protein